MAVVAALALLIVCRNLGVWRYCLSTPGALTRGSWLAVCGHILPLAAAAAIVLLAWGVGRRLLRAILAEDPTSGGWLHATSFALGLGAAGTSVFALGMAGMLSRGGLLCLGGVAACAAWRELREAPAGARRLSQRAADAPLAPWKALLAALIAYAAWHVVITGLAPATDLDDLRYHLALPKIYLREGRIGIIPWLIFSHWPHLMETLYAIPLALGTEAAAALLHGAASAALVAATFLVAREELDEESAWVAATLLACEPVVFLKGGAAHHDGALALFHFTAALAAWRWSRGGARAWLAIAGILSGFAAATKLPGMVLMATLAAWIAAQRRQPARDAGVFLAAGLAVSAPWYLKTWIGMGNPVWPFLARILGGRWGAEMVGPAFVASHNWTGKGWSWLFLHQEPPTLLLAVLVAVAALLLRGRSLPPLVRFLWIPVVPYMLVLSASVAVWRYSLPLIPGFALTVAWWFARSRGKERVLAALAAAACLAPVVQASQNNALFPVLGARSASSPELDSRSVYLARSLDNYRLIQDANRLLPPSAKVLLFREEAGYYLDRDYLWGNPTVQGVVDYREARDAGRLRERLAELGVTHVLVNDTVPVAGASPSYYRVLGLMGHLLAKSGRPVLRDGRVALYALD